MALSGPAIFTSWRKRFSPSSFETAFAANAVSKELGENRFRQLVKIAGPDKAKEMLERAEAGFKENYKLLTELAALPVL